MDQSQQIIMAAMGVAGAPVVAQLVTALVKPFLEDVRFYAAAAILLGIGWNVLGAFGIAEGTGAHVQVVSTVLIGVLSGLAAAGIASSAKAEVHQSLARDGARVQAIAIPTPPDAPPAPPSGS